MITDGIKLLISFINLENHIVNQLTTSDKYSIDYINALIADIKGRGIRYCGKNYCYDSHQLTCHNTTFGMGICVKEGADGVRRVSRINTSKKSGEVQG